LYAEGALATMQEFFVSPPYRVSGVGGMLLTAATELARKRRWNRLEVCTPPLPEFDRSLAFYERHGFDITGGRKLKRLFPQDA
jgi:GNAT superfamily N-acetyltransferase